MSRTDTDQDASNDPGLGREDSRRSQASDGNVGQIIKGLGREPAYLLIFGLFLLVTVGAYSSNLSPVLATVLAGIAFALAGLAIWLVQRGKQTSLRVASPEQHERLEGLRDDETAIRTVLEDMVDDETDTYFVYSSTAVTGFIDYAGKRIDFPFLDEERLVTAIPDAQGIAKIHGLLHVGGKRKRLHIETARSLPASAWEANVILVGSRNANAKTELALEQFNAPYRFNEDVSAVVEAGTGSGRWPENRSELEHTDYGILIKLKVKQVDQSESIYLIAAGIGGLGTLASAITSSETSDAFRSGTATLPSRAC